MVTSVMERTRDSRIEAVQTTIVDIPLRRAHAHSRSTTRAQGIVVVELRTGAGIVGIGEGVTPGGPWWGGDSAETIKLMIDRYLAPTVLGCDVFLIEQLLARMDKVAARNQFAKAAVEMAAQDAVGRLLGIPLSHLLGGAVRPALPVLWPLGIGRLEEDVAEAQAKIDAGQHRMFKIKMGADAPEADVRRVVGTARAIGAPCRVDLNQAWNEPTAARWLPHLEAGGIELVEAPIQGWNRDGMRRLAERLLVPIMADEEVWDLHDHWNVAVGAATDVVAVKVAKSGGVLRARKIAALAEAAGLPCYGGMALESSIGTAASAHLFATIPNLEWGCESVGPLLLADDLVVRPVEYYDGTLIVPDAPGLGVELDRSKLAHYRRDA